MPLASAANLPLGLTHDVLVAFRLGVFTACSAGTYTNVTSRADNCISMP